MTERKVKLIDTSKLEARYETSQSESDRAATSKCESIRVYAVTVHDGRGAETKWDAKAWLVEEIRTSRWQGEESPVIGQELVIGAKMPTPRVSSRFGDAVDVRKPRSRVEEIGMVILRDGVAVLRNSAGGNVTQYEVPVTDGGRR